MSDMIDRHDIGAGDARSAFRISAPPTVPVAALLARTEAQAQALHAGDLTRWLGLINLGDDFTLMQPFGGPASHGFDGSPEHLAELSRRFSGGTAKIEVDAVYASDDLVVLAFVERQHGIVFDLPDQEWSLRVTQVYRRAGASWQLVHRHADPLTHQRDPARTAALARGE